MNQEQLKEFDAMLEELKQGIERNKQFFAKALKVLEEGKK